MKAAKIIFGAVCGAFFGTAVGIAFAMCVGILAKLSFPSDPSAGSAATIVIATAPLGMLIGLIIGGMIVVTHPKVFWFGIFPVVAVLTVMLIIISWLRGIDRPREFALDIQGTPDSEIIGTYSVNGGARTQFRSKIPTKIDAAGLNLEFEVSLRNFANGDKIIVKPLVNGSSLGYQMESDIGMTLELHASGYSETFGGTGYHHKRMSRADAEDLSQRMSQE
jgi:MFS family permease